MISYLRATSGRKSVGGALGRPSPRQEFVDTRGGPKIDELCEHVGEVSLRIDAVQFAGLDERSDGCPVLRPLIVAGEERVLPIEHNGAREVRPEMTARMRDEAQRPNDYIYSDKERAILNQLIACSTTFTHYSECSVQ